MTKPQSWYAFKAKSTLLGKTITQVAREVPCSTRSVKLAVKERRCPNVRRRLEEMGLIR